VRFRSVILLLRSCRLLLFKGLKACFHPSVYVDAHGETDENLRRGKPLFLNTRRYAAVEAMWCVSSHNFSLVFSASVAQLTRASLRIGRVSRGVAAAVARTRNSADMIIRDGYF
jgi:hypothetical protein